MTLPPSHPIISLPTLRPQEIEAFRAVMIRGTATEAAILLHKSQPVISKLIARLQRSIGIKLFELRKSRLVPTPEARIIFKAIEQAYVGLEHVAQTISELQGGHSGRLIIGSLPSFAIGPLSQITAEFLHDEPSLQVSIETVNSSLIRQSVISGKIDVGVTLRSIDVAGVHVEPLVTVNTVCVMSPSHPLAKLDRIHAQDLDGQRMILPSRDSATRAAIDQMLGDAGVQPQVVAETSYAMTMCVLAMQGAGAAIVSPFAAMVLADAGLIVRPFEPRQPTELVLLTALDSSPSRISEMFINRLKTHMRELKEQWD